MGIILAPGETKQINIVLTTEFIEEQPLYDWLTVPNRTGVF